MTAKVFGEDPKAPGMVDAQRTLESVKKRAAAERATIPAADKAVAANANGEEMYKAGKTYFSSAEYAKAAAGLQKALAKGGLTKADDARNCWRAPIPRYFPDNPKASNASSATLNHSYCCSRNFFQGS